MNWQIDFWDVGQGDASVVWLPTGEYILIDTGGLRKRTNPLVSWFQPPYPSKTIHSIVITHNHCDHVGGLENLAHSDQVIRNIYFTEQKAPKKNVSVALLACLRQRADSGKTQTMRCETGVVIFEDELFCLKVLHPEGAGCYSSLNESSAVVALIRKRDSAILVIWGADAHLKTVSECCPNSKPAVLVGPHHGAPQDTPKKTNTFDCIFAERLRPQNVFVSVGRGNTYGHPSSPYIKSAVRNKVSVCCSEVSEQCQPAEKGPFHFVYQGSAKLGLPAPAGVVQCRGTMRILFDANGDFHFDEHQAAFKQAVAAKVEKALCLRNCQADDTP